MTKLPFSSVLSHPVVSLISSIREDYVNNRFTFIPGEVMKEILRYLGANEVDLRALQYCNDYLGDDPTLDFRKSRNGRFLIDHTTRSISRLSFQPFVLSKEEDFVRDDSGQYRHFRGIQDTVQQNTAFQALLKFKAWVTNGITIVPRPKLDLTTNQWVSTVFQLRTITSSKLIGEPAKEGVHSDGVEHTMTTFLYARNMDMKSAVSTLHTNDELNGTHWSQINPDHVIGQYQHRHYLDTLMIVDTECKHSISSLEVVDSSIEAIRDMLIFFSRRPKGPEHSTYANDPIDQHPEIPMNVTL